MTHVTDIFLGAALIAALSAGTIALVRKPESTSSNVILPGVETGLQRTELLTKEQRLAVLESRLSEIASEQRRLIDELKAASRGMRPR